MTIPAVIIILDPSFGELLVPLVSTAPIWIVATEANKATYDRIWHEHKREDHRQSGAVTAFNVKDIDSRIENLFNVLPDIKLHHALSKDDIIEIIGVPLGKEIADGLQKDGFLTFIETPNSFKAKYFLSS